MTTNECNERLKEIELTKMALNILYIQLEREKQYLESCIKNPSLDNLHIVENYYRKREEFIRSLIK